MSDVGADVLAEWRVVPENVVSLSVLLWQSWWVHRLPIYIYKCGDRVYLGIKCSML